MAQARDKPQAISSSSSGGATCAGAPLWGGRGPGGLGRGGWVKPPSRPPEPRRVQTEPPLFHQGRPVLWRDLFGPPRSKNFTSMTFKPFEVRAGRKVARCTNLDLQVAQEAWANTIVGYVLDKMPSYQSMVRFIQKNWVTKCKVDVWKRSNGYFIFKFTDAEDMHQVLESQPWLLDGHVLVLRKWERGLELRRDLMMSVPVWIRLPWMGLHLWTDEMLARVASCVGIPLYMDQQTANRERIEFAQICVEVDAECELPDEVAVEFDNQDVELVQVTYDWEPKRCPNCKIFGHGQTNCPVTKVWQEKVRDEAVGQEGISETEQNAMEIVCVQPSSISNMGNVSLNVSNLGGKDVYMEERNERKRRLVPEESGTFVSQGPSPVSSKGKELVVSEGQEVVTKFLQLSNAFEALMSVEEGLPTKDETVIQMQSDDQVASNRFEKLPDEDYNRVVSMVEKLRSKNKTGKMLAVTHAGLKENIKAANKPDIIAVVSKEWEAKMASI